MSIPNSTVKAFGDITSFSLDGVAKTFAGVAERLMDKTIRLGILLIGVLAALWLVLNSISSFSFSPVNVTTTTEIRNILLGNIQAESLLVTASQTVDANVAVQKVARIIGIPVGGTNLVYAAVGKANTGINIHDVEVVDFDQKARTVKLNMPPVELSISFDPEHSETLANYRNWFGPKAGAAIYEQAQREAYAVMKSKVCSSPLMEAAIQNAEYELEAILTKVGFQTIEFQVAPPTEGACQVA